MGKTKSTEKTKRKGGKKVFLTILGILLALILILVIFISVNASKNVKAMDSCVDGILTELNKNYKLTPRDPGEYDGLTLYGIMKFNVEQYDIEELGNLSIMRVNVGLMQMATMVITPKDKNLPLFSADYMYILGNRKSYVEFYDVVAQKDEQYSKLMEALGAVQDKYSHLPDLETSPAWYDHLLTVASYKDTKSDADEETKALLLETLSTYLTLSKDFPVLSDSEKAEKIALSVEYTDGLIEKGGISTDVFKKELGNEKTKDFFDKVFFGTLTQ